MVGKEARGGCAELSKQARRQANQFFKAYRGAAKSYYGELQLLLMQIYTLLGSRAMFLDVIYAPFTTTF
jgi:hypothetical protein